MEDFVKLVDLYIRVYHEKRQVSVVETQCRYKPSVGEILVLKLPGAETDAQFEVMGIVHEAQMEEAAGTPLIVYVKQVADIEERLYYGG